MSFYNFPNPSDMNIAYIAKVSSESLDDLVSHLQLRLEKLIAPQTSAERAHSAHIIALISATRNRMESVTKN